MALVRWSPVRDVLSVQNEMNRLFHEVWGRSFDPETPTLWQPVVDVEEHADGYTLRAELPGMKLEDLKITLVDNQLVIRGEKKREVEKKDANYHRSERVFGAFERVFTLSQAVGADKIEATYRDGVLEVKIPKAEDAKPREIPIKTSH
jgi:HSP20 family protein